MEDELCGARLGEHKCVVSGDHVEHRDGQGHAWVYRHAAPDPQVVAVERVRAQRRQRRLRRQSFARGVLLFVLACGVGLFVAYVYVTPPGKGEPYHPAVVTLPPGVVPVPATTVP